MQKWMGLAGAMLLAGAVQAAPVTALDVRINAAEWMNSHADVTNKTSTAISALGISDLHFSVQVEEGTAFAVARIETTLPDAQSVWLNQTNLVQLESVSADEYKWIPAEPKKRGLKIPAFDNLRVRFDGSTVTVADPVRFPVAEQMDSAPMNQVLLRGAAKISVLFEPLCNVVESVIDAQEKGFGQAMIAGMWKSVAAQFNTSTDIPVTQFEIVSAGPDTRQMDLRLEYKNADAAQRVQSFFGASTDAWKNPAVSGKQLSLMKLTETPHFRGNTVKGNEVAFAYEWPVAADSDMLKIVGQSVFGGMSGMRRGNTFPLNEKQVIAVPNIGSVDRFNAAQAGEELRAALFFNHCWSSSVDFEFDYVDLPNTELVTATFTNISVTAAGGEEMAIPGRQPQFRFDPKDNSAQISLPIAKGEGEPSTVSFTIQLEVPTQIETHTLTPENYLMESGDKGCCLVAMSNSVVSLRSRNFPLREAKIYARDAEGDYLARSGASWSDSNYRATYNGSPASVELVWPVKTEPLTLTFTDLPAGKDAELKMPSSPTNSIVTRYTLEPPETFCDPDLDDFFASSMTYVTNAGWKKDRHELRFPKPENVEVEKIGIKTYLDGVDEFVSMGQKDGYSYADGMFVWRMNNTNELEAATAIFGEIAAEFWSGTGSYTADNLTTNATPLIAGQDLPAVSVEQNVVWVTAGKEAEILGVQAFDSTGRRLKKDNRTSWNHSRKGYFFWGKPVKVTVDYASEKAAITVPVEVLMDECGLCSRSLTQYKVDDFEELLEVVTEVSKKQSDDYGTLLAANYYADKMPDTPRADIPLEVAQSDPAGAEVFNYILKPYKGYYFKKIPTERDLKQERPLNTYQWSGGEFQASYCRGVLLALPVKEGAPAVLVRWGDMYVNYADCSKLESIDSDSRALEKAGWIRIR